jgi:tripartite-type tricarboxylate transporter receptor subunit TctC
VSSRTVTRRRLSAVLVGAAASAGAGTLLEGKSRAVAVTGRQRSPFLPGVPTAAEAGVPGYEVVSWNGIFVRAGTAPDVVDTLNAAIHDIVAIPEVKERYADLGIEAQASSPAELKDQLVADIAKWAAVIERAGIAKQ